MYSAHSQHRPSASCTHHALLKTGCWYRKLTLSLSCAQSACFVLDQALLVLPSRRLQHQSIKGKADVCYKHMPAMVPCQQRSRLQHWTPFLLVSSCATPGDLPLNLVFPMKAPLPIRAMPLRHQRCGSRRVCSSSSSSNELHPLLPQ